MAGQNGAGEITVRSCGEDEHGDMLALINAAAEAYRGVIPADRWHDPYMSSEDLASEIAEGVVFSGALARGRLVGVMGVQRRCNVVLIRHAYVWPEAQRQRVGSALIGHLCRGIAGAILVGTWRAAHWAIGFYERHGFEQVDDADAAALLRRYWTVPERQVATSVVLARPPLRGEAASRLMAGAGRSAARPPDLHRCDPGRHFLP